MKDGNMSFELLNSNPTNLPYLENVLLPMGDFTLYAKVYDGLNAVATANMQCKINVNFGGSICNDNNNLGVVTQYIESAIYPTQKYRFVLQVMCPMHNQTNLALCVFCESNVTVVQCFVGKQLKKKTQKNKK